MEEALRQIADAARAAPDVAAERCDLCAAELADVHPHLFDASERMVLCACPVCTMLFPQRADPSSRYRTIPGENTAIGNFAFDDLDWRALEIPVKVAYFVRSTAAGRVVAYYPSPVGAVESLLPLDAWQELEQRNPLLREIAPDIQAVLVNGIGDGPAKGWLVGIDTCYRLVAVMRAHWRGLRGGSSAQVAINKFFEELREDHVIKGVV